MKHRTTLSICLAFLVSSISSAAFAGAWVPEKGSGYHKLGSNYFEADDFFGTNEGFEEFTSRSLVYYGEVGIFENAGLFWSLPFQDISQTIDGQESTFSGLSDVEVGFRYQWKADPYVLSTAITFKAPYFYDEDELLPPGNGQEDVEVRVLFGKSLGRFGYFGLEGGYRFRTSDPSDEIRYLIEYGFGVGENFYFRTKLDGIQSARNASGGSPINNFAVTPEFNLGRLELTTGWNFGPSRDRKKGRWGAEFTWTNDLYGEDTLQGNTFQLGIVYQH